MEIPKGYLKDFQATPPALREMLKAELAVGNSIVEVGHGFPATPVGAYFLLETLVTTRVRQSRNGLRFRASSMMKLGIFMCWSRRFHSLK